MITDLPPLTWLRAFEAAARSRSFTHAAAELHLTQAAISKHVKALEQHLRQPLFIRHARSCSLYQVPAALILKRDSMSGTCLMQTAIFISHMLPVSKLFWKPNVGRKLSTNGSPSIKRHVTRMEKARRVALS